MATKQRKIDALVDFVAHDCAESGIELIFKNSETIDNDKHTVGFFSEDEKQLVVATKDEDWVRTLAHEHGHLRQWQEGLFKNNGQYEKYESWRLKEIDLDAATVIACTRAIQACELDCEKRAVKLLTEFDLLGPNGKREYIRQANAYVLMYEIARRYRGWTKAGRSPMENKKVYNLLPTKFIKDLGRVPDDFEAAVLDNCY